MPKRTSPHTWTVGERCWVAIDSWAGRSTHPVEIDALLDNDRARVRWLDRPVFRKIPGRMYNVPRLALRKQPIPDY